MKYVSWLVSFWIFLPSIYGQNDTTRYDPFLLDEVIISDFSQNRKLNSANSVFSLKGEEIQTLSSPASQLATVPGLYVDASLGEVFSRVHARGVSLSAEDDIGWYYTALYEDDLPVSAIQFNHFTPDFFFRQDVSIERMEFIQGGKSGIIGQNAPGGMVNYVTHPLQQVYTSHDKVTIGIYNNGELYGRAEGYSGGPIGQKGWHHGFSYMFRYDNGARDTDYTFNKGGQIKGSIHKIFRNGVFSFRTKFLDDQVNRYTGLAATNWENPTAAFDQNFSSTSLLPPSLTSLLPDPRTQGIEKYEYNPARGIKSKELAFQSNLDLDINGWHIKNRSKYSIKSLQWQSAIGGQPIGLENFLTYFISGDPFPIGQIRFTESNTGNVLALVDNSEVVNVFQGLPPGFQYLEGSLPNDAIMGTGSWYKDDSIDEFMTDWRVRKVCNDYFSWVGGLFYSHTAADIFTNASFIYTTYESDPRSIEVSLENPGDPARNLSDPFGLSNYGALFYDGAGLSVNQFSLYGELQSKPSDLLTVDFGYRFENIGHTGTKDRFEPLNKDGGLDGNNLSSYDNGLLVPTGRDEIDFNYNYLSYSLGINYELTERTTTYMRYSNTNKAPELNYYLSNFSNVPVSSKGEIQDIQQLEMGIKRIGQSSSLTLTGFYSRLDDVPFTEFVFDQDNNQIFYTPTQLNSSETLGLEAKWTNQFSKHFGFNLDLTLQRGRLSEYRQYQPNGTIDTGDDSITDFSGNHLPHNSPIMGKFEVFMHQDRFRGSIHWRYLGSRYANFENSFELNSFSSFGLLLEYDISSKLYIAVTGSNIFNSQGLINFFGPNEFGSNANQATADYISQNPDASFVVFPILPRSFYLSVGYRFEKNKRDH